MGSGSTAGIFAAWGELPESTRFRLGGRDPSTAFSSAFADENFAQDDRAEAKVKDPTVDRKVKGPTLNVAKYAAFRMGHPVRRYRTA